MPAAPYPRRPTPDGDRARRRWCCAGTRHWPDPWKTRAHSARCCRATQRPADDASLRDALRELPEVSRPLVPWALGFQNACSRFPALLGLNEPAVDTALARVFRHLPVAEPKAREAFAELERAMPLATEDDAVDDLVMAVAELWELTNEYRLAVATVRRAAPKVGRNEPCPCGSGRKFKHCHGA